MYSCVHAGALFLSEEIWLMCVLVFMFSYVSVLLLSMNTMDLHSEFIRSNKENEFDLIDSYNKWIGKSPVVQYSRHILRNILYNALSNCIQMINIVSYATVRLYIWYLIFILYIIGGWKKSLNRYWCHSKTHNSGITTELIDNILISFEFGTLNIVHCNIDFTVWIFQYFNHIF